MLYLGWVVIYNAFLCLQPRVGTVLLPTVGSIIIDVDVVIRYAVRQSLYR